MVVSSTIEPLLETLFDDETLLQNVKQGLSMFLTEQFPYYPPDIAWDIEAVRETTHEAVYTLLHVMDKAVSLGDSQAVYQYLTNKGLSNKSVVDTSVEDLRMESQLECYKCKQAGKYCRNVETQEKQTRSADESATVFATCLNCRSRWKFAL